MKLNNKGQVLLITIVSLTVALLLVASLAVRSLTSQKKITQTDSFSRVNGASEAGIERFLVLNQSQLSTVVTGPSNTSCPMGSTVSTSNPTGRATCSYSWPANGSDTISETAYVWVENYPAANSPVDVQLKKDETYELILGDGILNTYQKNNVTLCWKSRTAQPVYVYVTRYTSTQQDKSLIACSSGCNWGQISSAGAAVLASNNPAGNQCGSGGYTSFIQLSGMDTWLGLRVRVIGSDADVRFVPQANSSFAYQGFLINSLGVLTNNSTVQASKTTKAFRSYTYTSGPFDFGIYTDGVL